MPPAARQPWRTWAAARRCPQGRSPRATGEAQAARRRAARWRRRRLAAAAQVIGPVASTYRWEGRLTHADEWLCLLKTDEAQDQALERTIRSLHSYKLPGILAIPVAAGSPPYLAWLAQELQGRS